MNWICKNCGKTMTTNSEKPPLASGCKKGKDGKPMKHNWVKR